MLLDLCVLLLVSWGFELGLYFLLTPCLEQPPLHPSPFLKQLGTAAYRVAYFLSLLRAPLGLLPYLLKIWLQLGLNIRYEARTTTYRREILNMFGEIANVTLTWVLISLIVGPARSPWWVIACYLPVWAECVRLLAERIPILFSAAWQVLPHRQIARSWQPRTGQNHTWKALNRYCYYYSLNETERADYILRVLKQRSIRDEDVFRRLAYVRKFRIVPQQQGLRGGLVRDVARGEIFIHATWTSDPWLLIGMALRRSPWPFDPRFLRRPFYYMSEANRVTSLFTLRQARYSLPFALFQFGHEIRVARLHFFYVLLRSLGADIERKVAADSTFQNDQCIFWLRQRLSRDSRPVEPRPLYSDEEVIAELAPAVAAGSLPSAQEIAARYTFPLKYVEEVLLARVVQTQEVSDHEFASAHNQ